MNTADRSLAMVDYALRRRFAFIDLEPGIGTPQFAAFLKGAGASEELVERIVRDMRSLNEVIASDTANLGPGFSVGHSYFCSVAENGGATAEWYRAIVQSEILPLLREYWFDDPKKVAEWNSRLLRA